MHWIIDGMNVVGSRHDGWWRDRPAARARLVAEIGAWRARRGAGTAVLRRPSRRTGTSAEAGSATAGASPAAEATDEVDVVFNGRHRADEVTAGAAVGVAVSFAPGGPNAADRVIAEMARRADPPTVVVTSDATLAAEVRAAGAAVEGAAAFGRRLGAPGG